MKVLAEIQVLERKIAEAYKKKYDTLAKRIKAIKKPNFIWNFKKPLPNGRTFIISKGVVKEKGKYRLEGEWWNTPWFDSLEKLVKTIDWVDFERRSKYEEFVKGNSPF